MVIRKVGNKFCVFSEEGKNLGCSSTKDEAIKRLKQVEYFKDHAMLNEAIFENFKLNADNSKSIEQGTIAGLTSEKILDKKEHFPVITPDQAKSSLNRVMKLEKVPDWYSGSIEELKQAVYAGVKEAHPKLNVKISVPIAVALSDGQTPPETQKSQITDPNKVAPDHVKKVGRPTLGEIWAQESEATRQVMAAKLVEMLQERQEKLELAMGLASRLIKSGLDGAEFEKLHCYLQEEILHSLMQCGTVARKQELINKIAGK